MIIILFFANKYKSMIFNNTLLLKTFDVINEIDLFFFLNLHKSTSETLVKQGFPCQVSNTRDFFSYDLVWITGKHRLS